MRNSSPHAAIEMPAIRDWRVGCARISTSTPNTKPSATRRRAMPATRVSRTVWARPRRRSDTIRLRGQAAFDGADHLSDLDVEQAHAIEPAALQMVALTDGIARHGDVERRHRA